MNIYACPGCGQDAPLALPCATCEASQDVQQILARLRATQETLAREREDRQAAEQRVHAEVAAAYVQTRGLTALYDARVRELYAIRDAMPIRDGERLLSTLTIVERRMVEYRDMTKRLGRDDQAADYQVQP